MAASEVAIIFPTYNRPDEVERTLQFLRQNVQLSYEVWILDNSDSEYKFGLASKEYHIRMGYNAGTAARNVGIRRTRAPYILMLDDDSHPLPGAITRGVENLKNAPPSVAGCRACVTRPDGSLEYALLPTVLLGCGVLFRRNVLNASLYPEEFGFYGEEYWVTLSLYREGFRLIDCAGLQIRHRVSSKQRDLWTVFYHLSRNNDVIWQEFTPERFRERVLYDTRRRYELIAEKEEVQSAYEDGRRDALTLKAASTPLAEEDFEAFSLLTSLRNIARDCDISRPLLLCGTGKFPTLWAEELKRLSAQRNEIWVADWNPGIAGKQFDGYTIQTHEQAKRLAESGALCITGHTSIPDTERWEKFLQQKIQTASLRVFRI